jgi:peptidoglycan/xylan/chitin deacetylase (PgdA/CDA1 family)
MRAEQGFFDDGCGCDHDGGAETAKEPSPRISESIFTAPSAAPPSSRRRFLRTAAVAALGAPALLAEACSSGSKTSSAQQPPAQGGTPGHPAPSTSGGQPPASALPPGSRPPGPETADAALLAGKYQGLKPFAPAPPAPAAKPVNTDLPLPPVVDQVPTDQKICFLTIDDGAEKDPIFLEMVKDFRIPITLFLTDVMIRDDYGYFTRLRDTGYCTIENHTLTHPNLVQVSAEKQQAEITGQQQKLIEEYGTTPRLFRAPYGNSNAATQQACKDNGLKAIMRWRASFQKQGFQWQAADKRLRPGDVLLAHFRGPKSLGAGWPEMHQLMINLFKIVQGQGYTFARLEDYV